MRRLWLAAILAPAAALFTFWGEVLAFVARGGPDGITGASVGSSAMYFSVIGLPIAYAACYIAAIPAYLVLERTKHLTLRPVLATASLLGGLVVPLAQSLVLGSGGTVREWLGTAAGGLVAGLVGGGVFFTLALRQPAPRATG